MNADFVIYRDDTVLYGFCLWLGFQLNGSYCYSHFDLQAFYRMSRQMLYKYKDTKNVRSKSLVDIVL